MFCYPETVDVFRDKTEWNRWSRYHKTLISRAFIIYKSFVTNQILKKKQKAMKNPHFRFYCWLVNKNYVTFAPWQRGAHEDLSIGTWCSFALPETRKIELWHMVVTTVIDKYRQKSKKRQDRSWVVWVEFLTVIQLSCKCCRTSKVAWFQSNQQAFGSRNVEQRRSKLDNWKGPYSYIRVLRNQFLLKLIVSMACEHNYMNMGPLNCWVWYTTAFEPWTGSRISFQILCIFKAFPQLLKCVWHNRHFFFKNSPWRDDSNDICLAWNG